MGYHKDGKEYLDDTPRSVKPGFKRPESIHEMIKKYIRSEAFNQARAAEGKETEQEANDFEIEDEEEVMITPHELSAMAAEELRDLEGEEAFRLAKQKLIDDYNKSMMALHREHGAGGETEKEPEDVRVEGTGDNRDSVSRAGEKRVASGGKGRSAGKRGSGVSKGVGGDFGVDEEGKK